VTANSSTLSCGSLVPHPCTIDCHCGLSGNAASLIPTGLADELEFDRVDVPDYMELGYSSDTRWEKYHMFRTCRISYTSVIHFQPFARM
jgi:hypothetical protein